MGEATSDAPFEATHEVPAHSKSYGDKKLFELQQRVIDKATAICRTLTTRPPKEDYPNQKTDGYHYVCEFNKFLQEAYLSIGFVKDMPMYATLVSTFEMASLQVQTAWRLSNDIRMIERTLFRRQSFRKNAKPELIEPDASEEIGFAKPAAKKFKLDVESDQ